jgi:polyadenylate-binding protein
MWSHRDPTLRRNNAANVFVKNLHEAIDIKRLFDLFSPHGTILSCKVALNNEMKSKGFGFVHYSSVESASAAIDALNNKDIEGKELYVAKFERRMDRTSGKYTNVFVKNVPLTWTEEDIRTQFSNFGKITSVCYPSKDGVQKGFAMVNFETHEQAERAVNEAKSLSVGETPLFADRFQSRAERDQMLARRTHTFHREMAQQSKNLNLYVKNLEEDMTDEQLKELFSKHGNVTSAVVMKDGKGISRGFGFVCFKTKEEADRALGSMNSSLVGKRRLFVNYAQRFEERRVFLESQFQASMVQRMQYSQLFFPPTAVPMQPMFQPMIPRLPVRGPPYASPYPQRGGGGVGGRGYFQHGGRGGAGVQGRVSKPRTNQPRYQQFVPPTTPAPIVTPSGASQGKDFAAVLAAESPERQKNILGERLFPLIQKEHGDLAGKITGMLLEMEVSEILSLLESPGEREAKIKEALDVLNAYKPN